MADYDDWFSQTFNIDTSGQGDLADSGGYSGGDYDAMFAQNFGDVAAPAGLTSTYGTSPGGTADTSFTGGTGTDASSGGFLGFVASAGGTIADAFKSAFTGAMSLFTNPEKTVTGPDGTTKTTGGGINTLGQTLLAGALQSLGQGQVLKWQADRVSKEKALDRRAVKEAQAEKYRRAAYGEAPQIAQPSTGVGLIHRGGV